MSAALLLAACGQETRVGAGADWFAQGGTADESNYSALDTITAANAGKLGLAWALDLPGEVTLEATPLAVDGVLYFTGSYATVYAVEAASGKLLWKYDPEVWNRQVIGFGVNRGVAFENGRVFVGTLDGRLIALDAKTGKELWSANTLPGNTLHYITGAPRTFNGKVIIGNGGADIMGQRGFVTAYDAATGKELWRFYTVPGSPEQNKGDAAMEMAAKTWGNNEYWKTGTGGTVWNDITFDPELNRIYLGVGNGGPYSPEVRSPGGGDNLFLASIVALDADTGKYVWHYQMNPNEAWDYKCTANMISGELKIDGKTRKVLMQAPTNGFFYVIDRETGKLISAEKTGKVTWAERIDVKTGRPVEHPNIRYEQGEVIIYPSMIGSHNWQDMSFNPKTGLVYIPYMQLGAKYSPQKDGGAFNLGAHVEPYLADPNDGKGALLAWDPVAQQERWKVPLPTIWNGGTMTTAGNVVFMGMADGYFIAYDATTGRELWKFNAGLGIVAPPISYSAGGKQYVSVLVGYGGTTAALSSVLNVGWKYGAQPRRLLTFSLDGTATLPPSPGPDMKVYALDDPSLTLAAADVEVGRALAVACMACHGMGLVGAGSPGPDLRESPIALTKDGLWDVLHEGSLRKQGMPKFPQFTREQSDQIFAYIRAGARDALAGKAPKKEALPN